MKRLIAVLGVFTMGYLAADSGLLKSGLQAQAPAEAGRGRSGRPNPAGSDPRAAQGLFLVTAGPETKAVHGKAVLWTAEQLAKPTGSGLGHIQWTPEYRMTMTTRQPAEPGKEPTSGELHDNNTQIYIITGGSGSVLVEGTVDKEKEYLVAPGEHRGGPITNGRIVKVKAGDVLSIPPYTWHIGWGDPGTPLTYMMVHVHTPTTIP
jgi:mannose-6-phosphate isomerase-like protein (cupin superfamily)